MHHKQVRLRFGGESDSGQACVHRRGNARDLSSVFDLQPIRRSVVILHLRSSQQLVAVGNNFFQRALRHLKIKTKRTNVASANVERCRKTLLRNSQTKGLRVARTESMRRSAA